MEGSRWVENWFGIKIKLLVFGNVEVSSYLCGRKFLHAEMGGIGCCFGGVESLF